MSTRHFSHSGRSYRLAGEWLQRFGPTAKLCYFSASEPQKGFSYNNELYRGSPTESTDPRIRGIVYLTPMPASCDVILVLVLLLNSPSPEDVARIWLQFSYDCRKHFELGCFVVVIGLSDLSWQSLLNM